ncbi:MAG: helix-turn-helix transcriptional regulator [Syntrophomonadaceae bacterium]|nr:helix-turn-helix transcriptional regulator [Syntrophomonadaceae bacterium]
MSIFAFSFLSAYLLSFQFEGQVLYSLLNLHQIETSRYILVGIVAHFVGLFSCGFFIRSSDSAKKVMLAAMGLCAIVTIPFFFAPTILWVAGLLVGGYASGCAVASWGWFLKDYTPKNERIKSSADVLIYSNIIMIFINVIAVNWWPLGGLILSILCLLIGIIFTLLLQPSRSESSNSIEDIESNSNNDIFRPLLLLCLFVVIITVNSGLMYQVINPAFQHLTGLVSWYWAVPYIIALILMRNLPETIKRSMVLYIGMAMIIGAFISFMILGRTTYDYLVVDTLMLGACGIFDLFWWSILGEMLDYTGNPAKIFGIGLSSNVLGVLLGDILGMGMTSIRLPSAEVAVIALAIVSITLALLPFLNRRLVYVLKNHAYLAVYDNMSDTRKKAVLDEMKPLDPLTARELEVLQCILEGKSNREIAKTLFISESTVKTHARNIFSKYAVTSRAELISNLLRS